MSDTRTPDLLDVLRHTETYQWPPLPDGHVYGWRSITPDHRSRDGYRWPWPGQTAVAPDDGRDLSSDTAPDEPCPSATLGGLCLAVTWLGARSGGVPATTCLLVAYRPDDVLGRDAHKLRIARCQVLDVVDLRGADLRGANLGRANLWGADLRDADLRGADLRGADLGYANLRGAVLWGADLQNADLGYANLRDADLGYAVLRGADLRDTNLRDADLGYADLRDTNLRDADLGYANLQGANLWGANLWGADLGYANLGYANLQGANLWGANLWGANLWGADLQAANLQAANLQGVARSPDDPPVPGWRVVDGRLEADR